MRVLWIIGALAMSFAGETSAENTLQKIAWPVSAPEGVATNPDGSVTVVSASNGGLTVTLVEIDSPGIARSRYAVKGRVRYEGVVGRGYVEMWSVFADGRYFTRTIAEQGPMRALTGSSEWRSMVLPFDTGGSGALPESLVINVVLPGPGRVSLSPLTLVELDPGEWPTGVNDSAGSGLFGAGGAIAGASLGVVGAVLGWLGGMGKAKRLVLIGFRTLMAAGGVSLVLGVVAWTQGSAYTVYYPLLLIGAIALLVPASILPRLTKRYEEIELRQMSALDA